MRLVLRAYDSRFRVEGPPHAHTHPLSLIPIAYQPAPHLIGFGVTDAYGRVWGIYPKPASHLILLSMLHDVSCFRVGEPYTVHPSPYALHPTPYTPHHTPYTVHPTPYTLEHTLYTLNPKLECGQPPHVQQHPLPHVHPCTRGTS